MRLFLLWVELANVVTVQRLHDANPRERRRAAERRMSCVSTMLEPIAA
jgi:hypothetical protein